MADLYNDTVSATLQTALGGTVNAADNVFLRNGGQVYTTATLTADLTLFEMTEEYEGDFDDTALSIIVNQTGSGIFRNKSANRITRLTGASGSDVIAKIEQQPVRGGKLVVNSQTVTTIEAIAGDTLVGSTCVLTNYHGYGDLYAQILNNATALTLGKFGNRLTKLQRDLTSGTVAAGATLEADDSSVSPSGGMTVNGTLRVLRSGTFGGTLLMEPGSVLDLTRLGQKQFSVTNITWEPGSTLLYRKASGTGVLSVGSTETIRIGGKRLVGV